MAEILVVEDDKRLNELVCRNLKLVGHRCDSLFDGAAVYEQLTGHQYDLMILDVMLPEMDGFEVMEYIADMGVPVIFLTARTALKDRVKGLRLGADDYIVKPFEMLELQARVEAVLRRINKLEQVFVLGDLNVDLGARAVYRGQQQIDCSPKEFDLLEILVRNRNIALSRERLMELVWGGEMEGETRTVDVHVQRLRKKLELDDYIKTVYKIGYRLEVPL